jgi:hypothetical protein
MGAVTWHTGTMSCMGIGAAMLFMMGCFLINSWHSVAAPPAPAGNAVGEGDYFEKSAKGSSPALYADMPQLRRITLQPNGTLVMPEAVQQLKEAWSASKPLAFRGYIPRELLEWWSLGGDAPMQGKLAQSLGPETVEVLRYAHRGSEAQAGREQEDHRTRLMPVDGAEMLLSEFLQRKHQRKGRAWPRAPMAGEEFMFKRKVRRGYAALESGGGGGPSGAVGKVEAYVRQHTPRPGGLWRAVGAAGACAGAAGVSRFRYDDPMLRIQVSRRCRRAPQPPLRVSTRVWRWWLQGVATERSACQDGPHTLPVLPLSVARLADPLLHVSHPLRLLRQRAGAADGAETRAGLPSGGRAHGGGACCLARDVRCAGDAHRRGAGDGGAGERVPWSSPHPPNRRPVAERGGRGGEPEGVSMDQELRELPLSRARALCT